MLPDESVAVNLATCRKLSVKQRKEERDKAIWLSNDEIQMIYKSMKEAYKPW